MSWPMNYVILLKIIIVAPDRNRSGASNSLTLEQPLRVQKLPKIHIRYKEHRPTVYILR